MKSFQKILPVCAVLLVSGCNVFQVEDAEGTRGRGATAFDPYSSSASGAISLSLLSYKGCSIIPTGEPVTRGSLGLKDEQYPALCDRPDAALAPGPVPPLEPHEKLTVTANALYFLRELSLVDTVINQHTDFKDRMAPATWARKQSLFSALDWSGLTVGRDEWRSTNNRGTFQRETYYENAAWMISDTDDFTLEVFDADNVSRAKTVYTRADFLAENAVTGHTRVSWLALGVGRPELPGDSVAHPTPDFPAPIYQTIVKASFVGATNPFKSFRMPDLSGEGYIRVTWSLLPSKPFYFPVTFVKTQDLSPTCFKVDAQGKTTSEPVPCGFGLQQTAQIGRPANGKYFMPGERVDFQVGMRDGDGNALHGPDLMPSYNEYAQGASNGFAYFNDAMILPFREVSASESGYKVVGPLQDLKVVNGTYTLPYFSFPAYSEPKYYLDPGDQYVGGGGDIHPSTRLSVTLPPEAKPGTYTLMLKGHRYFQGERLNRLDNFFFQVGQEKATTYPGRVGNCQICHNGVNSLNNLHHGSSVDNVESCKTCHFEEVVGFMPEVVHRIHSGSRKYKQDKADCSMCHLTRESALRPSLKVCTSCHPTAHGSEYFDLNFQLYQNTPNAYGNCANACHVNKVPSQHHLPPN